MASFSDFGRQQADLILAKGDAQARGIANKGAALGGTIAQLGQLIPQQVQQAMRQAAEQRKEKAIQEIFQQHGADLPTAIQKVSAIDPALGMKLGEQYSEAEKRAAEITKMREDHEQKMQAFEDTIIGSATDPDSYAQGLITLKLAGIDVSKYPAEWTPSLTTQANRRGMTPQQRATMDTPPSPELVAQPGPDGKPIYGPKVAGAPVYEKPTAAAQAPNVGSFEDYVLRTYGPNPTSAQILEGRKKFNQSDDRAAGAQASDITVLTPGGLDMAALNYRKTGVMPALGMGDRTTRQRIINRAAQLTKADIERIEAGGTDLAGNRADFRANETSLVALQKQRDAIGAFEQTAKKNIDNFLETAKKVPDTGIPLLNTPVRWIAGAGGSADVAKYQAARQVAISEIAKIVQNPNLTGQLSDSARHEIEVFNPRSATLKQTIAVMTLLKQDMENRKTSLDAQLKETRGRIGGQGASTSDVLHYDPVTGTVK